MPDNDFNRSTEFSDNEETHQESSSLDEIRQESEHHTSDQDDPNVYAASESISSEKLADVVKGEIPSKCIRECLEEFFDDGSLRDFCQVYFNTLFRGINDRDGFSTIIRNIISHCDQHGKMEFLWEKIRIERPQHSKFDSYYQRWKEAVKRNRNERLNTNEYAYTKQDNAGDTAYNAENNPLDQKGEEFTLWFFRKLKKEEQSLLLTTALFQGLSRRKMVDVAKTLEDMLSR